ncbi:MAG: helix-turn-helix transcriptional regulator [Actinobacteria bacterium]|nr:helix-turn-helix transcriptional regulator [Actinomycetota bacterium]
MGDQTMETIDIALRRLMDEQGLTETDLAGRTELNQSTVNRYLRKRRGRQLNPRTIETITQLARAVGKDPSYFLEVRIYEARHQVEKAMREGLLSLETLETLLEELRLEREAREARSAGGTP